MPKYTEWCIRFYDHKKRWQDPVHEGTNLTPIESLLMSMHYHLRRDLKIDGMLSTEKIFLLNNIPDDDDDDPDAFVLFIS